MPFAPQQAMMQRKGPAMGPTPNPGGAPAPTGGLPTTGQESPNNLLTTAIAQSVNEQKKANANFAGQNIDQILRVVGVHMTQLMQSVPDAARHLNRAWAALSAAKKALDDHADNMQVAIGPGLGFSGAQNMGPAGNVGPMAGGSMGGPA